MNNLDDLFDVQPKEGFGNEPFDVDAWAAKKQAERQDAYNTAEAAALEISTDGDKFRNYLDVKARFIQHSATNALIIYAVSPQATEIRDFNGWKDLGASIKRDQKAIPILEPGDTYTREDGSIGTSWNVRKVFNISQTTARVRQRLPQRYDDRTLLTAMIGKSPVQVTGVDELPDNMGAYYDHEQQVIFVRRGMEAHDIFRSLSKEIAHAELAGTNPDYNRRDAGFSAYCISYVIGKRYGIDVSAYDFSRMPESFREADPKDIRAVLNEIGDVAKDVTGRMHRELEKAKAPRTSDKERG